MICCLMGELDVLLRRALGNRPMTKPQEAVAAAERIMEERYKDPFTMEELAREMGVSVSSLHTHFMSIRAQTPMQTLQGVRLRQALALLHRTSLPLEQVAEQCGYNSASHLSRHIKAATGCSPGQLRRKNGAA